ncbi:hypothetical protein Vretimale_12615 [Volvox reticuliferus]|uniref:Integrase catalytic domain-containing protein n=1 Tax=Volvox reticuliferus TaxID=1737510 RepID=A0A8J4LS38_9CHLO|nr:hypothetical protein Vretifemale_214 [Volvox reticuliferus]GIM08590.1 hypothetical protein Vretimale_12615 [Volvox reticuliferus]
MCRENMVTGMELDRGSLAAASSRICEPCIYAKQSRGPFPGTGHKAVKPLGLVHMDVCGPMPETSLGGSRYVTTVVSLSYLPKAKAQSKDARQLANLDISHEIPQDTTTTVLDDCTGLSAVAFTETKDTIGKKVRAIFEVLENIAGRCVKEVRTDRGREFVNQAMGDYFSNKGIIHGTTVGYTPEQNGAAERLNRTLLEKMRAMLVESELPQQLWAEALATANYLRNISPVAGAKVTPHEAFDEEEADDGAGMVLPSGGGGGTLDGSNMDIEMAENNSGPSTSSGQTAPPRGQANMPLALFPRTHNT